MTSIRFENTKVDYDAYVRHYATHSKVYLAKQKRTNRFWWYLAILFYCVSFVCLFFVSLPYGLLTALVAASIPSIGAAYTLMHLVRGFSYLYSNRASDTEKLNRFCSVKYLEATPEGINYRFPDYEGKMAWATLETIDSDSDYTYLYMRSGGALVIPNYRLDEGDLRTFLTEVGRHYHPDKHLEV